VQQAKVFLLDDPLSNLDAKLRTEMRVELKRLHQSLAATIIYVTYDQIEANDPRHSHRSDAGREDRAIRHAGCAL